MKILLKCMAYGACAGALANYALTFAFSYFLHLGYYAPCAAILPEYFGSELNAALIQALCACAAGAAAGLAFALRRGRLPRAVRVGRRKAAFR